jgi:hypothetical protein
MCQNQCESRSSCDVVDQELVHTMELLLGDLPQFSELFNRDVIYERCLPLLT